MIITHELVAKCSCPKDHKPDLYEVTVTTRRVIPVEDIIAALARLEPVEQYQEQFTVELARAIGAEVKTVGFHSGVKTTCVA